jgi:hypothetical protein
MKNAYQIQKNTAVAQVKKKQLENTRINQIVENSRKWDIFRVKRT